MSLRIRRGPESDRATKVLDLGELGYTTDTYRLYVGDGVTSGGRNVLATAAGTGLIWNPSTQKLDFNGSGSGIVSVSADTNPTLGGNLTLSGYNITGTGNINIAGTLNVSNGLSGNLNLSGRSIVGTGSINITGTVTSSALSSNVAAPTTSGYIINSPLTVGTNATPVSLLINSSSTNVVLTNTTDGAVPGGILIKSSRGTLASKTALHAGDPLAAISGFGYDGSNYVAAGVFGLSVDQSVTPTTGHVAGQFGAITISATGSLNYLVFNSSGVLSASGAVQVGSYNGSGNYPTGVKGMIIYDSSTDHFYGYNGSWVQFTGT